MTPDHPTLDPVTVTGAAALEVAADLGHLMSDVATEISQRVLDTSRPLADVRDPALHSWVCLLAEDLEVPRKALDHELFVATVDRSDRGDLVFVYAESDTIVELAAAYCVPGRIPAMSATVRWVRVENLPDAETGEAASVS